MSAVRPAGSGTRNRDRGGWRKGEGIRSYPPAQQQVEPVALKLPTLGAMVATEPRFGHRLCQGPLAAPGPAHKVRGPQHADTAPADVRYRCPADVGLCERPGPPCAATVAAQGREP